MYSTNRSSELSVAWLRRSACRICSSRRDKTKQPSVVFQLCYKVLRRSSGLFGRENWLLIVAYLLLLFELRKPRRGCFLNGSLPTRIMRVLRILLLFSTPTSTTWWWKLIPLECTYSVFDSIGGDQWFRRNLGRLRKPLEYY